MNVKDSQTMIVGSSLPVELLMRIFSEIRSSNPKAYKRRIQNCRQVCKQFDEIIVSLLFKNGVDLGYRPESPPCGNINREGVLGALTRYPHLATQIRDIFFRSPSSSPESAHITRKELNLRPAGPIDAWAEGSPLLQLPSVRTLTVQTPFFYQAMRYDGRGPISTGLRALLGHYLRAGTLTTLSISSVEDIPILDILSSSSLIRVEFQNCTFSEYPSLPASTQHTAADSLVSLSVRRTTGSTFPLAYLPNLPIIEKVDVISVPEGSNDHPNPEIFHLEPVMTPLVSHTFKHLTEVATENLNDWSIFCQTSQDHVDYAPPFPVLKKLSCSVTMGKQGLANIPVLAHIKSLKELVLNNIGMLAGEYYSSDLHLDDHILQFRKTLEILALDWTSAFDYNPGNFDYPLTLINTAIRNIATENVIETINLSMRIQIPCQRGPFAPDTTNLAVLANTLCQPGAFPCLRKVTLHTSVLIHEDIFEEGKTFKLLQSVMGPALSRLYASHDIEFGLTAAYDTDICCSVCYNSSDEEHELDEDEEESGDEDEDE